MRTTEDTAGAVAAFIADGTVGHQIHDVCTCDGAEEGSVVCIGGIAQRHLVALSVESALIGYTFAIAANHVSLVAEVDVGGQSAIDVA